MARAAVIALLAALAVLIHHETAAAAIGPTSSSAAHAMTPGMAMANSHPASATAMSGHAHGSTAAQDAKLTSATLMMNSADGLACSGMAMQHCSTASFEVVKLAPPAQTLVPWGLATHGAVTTGPKAAGTVDRAPPDLSVLSQLRL
ncbi:hypothetical protein [Streptomyces albogriseolus]|uniref:hypothetical protein n=1 Tax=Streptomyces TaxID=1883 RepID=UPI002254B725|nr:hypothetical protein [Streptomyces viridodiastaticus]MCX4624635.1 hypothetical protein [Streptomyces viridodiastaticus]